MAKIKKPTRILSIYPGAREMGFAVFEQDVLIRYGVKALTNERKNEKSERQCKMLVSGLIQKFNPHVIVLGMSDHPKRTKNPMPKYIADQTKKIAKKEKIKLFEYTPAVARKLLLKEDKPTRRNVALFIASLYPELRAYIPKERRILWSKKDFYWLNAFEACALALAYSEKRKRKNNKNIHDK